LLAAFLLMPLVTVAVVLRDAIVPDICDVDELENGQRREGLFTAVVNFVYKMEVSLCVVLVGYMLKLSGFNQKAIQQLPEVLTNLKWCAYLPNILFAVLALILAIKFPITEAFMTQVHEKLNQRRARREDP
jgi:GPH family glycoside/pentoside/hexuronide:cation symporter